MTYRFAMLAATLSLSACVTTAPKVDTVRLGDNGLSCSDLYAEISALEAKRQEVASDGDKKYLAGTVGLVALGLAPFTFGGSLLVAGAAGTGAALYAGSGALDGWSAAQLHARAQHLTALFNQKNCQVPQATPATPVSKPDDARP